MYIYFLLETAVVCVALFFLFKKWQKAGKKKKSKKQKYLHGTHTHNANRYYYYYYFLHLPVAVGTHPYQRNCSSVVPHGLLVYHANSSNLDRQIDLLFFFSPFTNNRGVSRRYKRKKISPLAIFELNEGVKMRRRETDMRRKNQFEHK